MMRLLAVAACLVSLLAAQDDLRQGLAALNKNDLAHARESLEKAAKQEPRSAVVWVALAQTCLKSGQKKLATEAAGRAEQFGAGVPTIQHALAMFYAGSGDLIKAADWERRSGAGAQEAFLSELGQALLKSGKFAEALALLEVGQRHFPKDAQIVLAYGVACYVQRHMEDAVNAFLQVIRLDDAIEQPYVFLGRMLERTGDRLPEVIASYEAWEKKAPDNHLPAFFHAKALLASPNSDAPVVEAELRRSIELNGAFSDSHLELGALLARQGKWPEAERELSRSIELDPGQARAHYELARVCLRLGKPEQAKAERAEYDRLKTAENATGQP